MFTLNFTAAPKTEEEVGLHRRLYEGHLRHQRSNPYRQLDHVYEPGFRAIRLPMLPRPMTTSVAPRSSAWWPLHSTPRTHLRSR